ncbi:hypothetical protein Plhal304r1_c024g0083451 [Plasmopara halstedii]
MLRLAALQHCPTLSSTRGGTQSKEPTWPLTCCDSYLKSSGFARAQDTLFGSKISRGKRMAVIAMYS